MIEELLGIWQALKIKLHCYREALPLVTEKHPVYQPVGENKRKISEVIVRLMSTLNGKFRTLPLRYGDDHSISTSINPYPCPVMAILESTPQTSFESMIYVFNHKTKRNCWKKIETQMRLNT